jgi:solute carrier family 25 protein 39/40
LIENAGIKGLWAGVSAGMLMSVPSTVIYMNSYERAKILLSPPIIDSSPSNQHLVNYFQFVKPAVAGAISRLISVSIVSPIELIRTIQTASQDPHNTAAPASRRSVAAVGLDIFRTSGFTGLYRGWTATVLRDVPYSAIYWLVFESLKPLVSKQLLHYKESDSEIKSHSSHSTSSTFVAGSLAGLVAAVITHPFDVLKTQQQLSQEKSSKGHTNGAGGTSLATILRRGGLGALYSGLSLRLSTVIPGGAIMVTVYEYVKNL